jgi:S1-C subfamily serine protease
VGFAGHQIGAPTSTSLATQPIPSPSSSSGVTPKSSTLNVSAVAAKVDPGVVDVTAADSYQNQTVAGTGMILTLNGEVLTNNHVIDGASSITA